jgi:hypothetical protein
VTSVNFEEFYLAIEAYYVGSEVPTPVVMKSSIFYVSTEYTIEDRPLIITGVRIPKV